SSGKTTTKQMLAAVCAARGPVLATEGNLNNHIGVPLTLLRLHAEHRTAVIEMGANHAGEIALLAQLARPDIGIVTQAGDAHLEGFGSREGVAHAKGELFSALGGRGVAVVNRDDTYFDLWLGLAGAARRRARRKHRRRAGAGADALGLYPGHAAGAGAGRAAAAGPPQRGQRPGGRRRRAGAGHGPARHRRRPRRRAPGGRAPELDEYATGGTPARR